MEAQQHLLYHTSSQQSFTNNVIVKVDNDVLRSGFTKQHILAATGGNLIREYRNLKLGSCYTELF